MELVGKKLMPSANMHLKNKDNGDIYDTYIYLGKYDSQDNYIEVSEEEYQAFINRGIEEVSQDETN